MEPDNIANQLTPKETKVVEAFEAARSGLGAIALQNIFNPNSGWAEIAEFMEPDEIVVRHGFSTNSGFMHRYIH